MDKSKELERSVLFPFILFTALISLSKSDSIMTVTEGEIAKLEFPYPCDSEIVTIQNANRAPFYSSTDNQLHLPNYDLPRCIVEAKNCSAEVKINPVTRHDEATYICIAYKNQGILEFIKVRLNVDYPPGRVSCEPSDKETVGDWIPLQCEASVGSLDGEIVCYQDAKRLPPYNELIQTDEILKQTIWVIKQYPVACCSFIFDQPKDMCDCHDFVWDPSNTESVLHPCLSTTRGYGTTSQYQGENTDDNSFTETTTQLSTISNMNKVIINPWFWCCVTTSFLAIILLVKKLCLSKANKQMIEKQLQQTEIHGDNDCQSPSSETKLVHQYNSESYTLQNEKI